MAIVGIDLGLSRARIGWLEGPEDPGEPRVAAPLDGSPALPAAVRLTNPGPSLIGAAALQGTGAGSGGGYLVPSVRRALAAPAGADDSEVRAYGHTPESVAGLVLGELAQQARSAGVGRIEQAVLGIPADFDLAATEALRRAAEGTELRTPRFALEPVAVALHYRLGEGVRNVVVCDLGGARREVTALMISGLTVRIVHADFAELGPVEGGAEGAAGWEGAGPRGAESTAQAVREVIERAKAAGMAQTDAVLLAGGGLRDPAAAAALTRLLGIEVRSAEPELAVVKGLARYAHLRLLRVENLYGKGPREALRPLPYLEADPSPPARAGSAKSGPGFEAADPSPPTRARAAESRPGFEAADPSPTGRAGSAKSGPAFEEADPSPRSNGAAGPRPAASRPVGAAPPGPDPAEPAQPQQPAGVWARETVEQVVVEDPAIDESVFSQSVFDDSVFNESVFNDFDQGAAQSPGPSGGPSARTSGGLAAGPPTVLVPRPVERLTAVRREGDAVLTFAWPAGAETAIVRWRTGRGPDTIAGATDSAKISRRVYEHEGAVTVKVGLGTVEFTVEALVPGDGETEEPPSRLDLARPRTAVRYLPEITGLGRRRVARITLTSDDSCALPDLLVIHAVGRYMPSGPHEGTVVHRIPACDLYGLQPVVVEFPLPQLPRESWLVCFPAEPSAAGIDLFPQSVHRLKVR